ncbi:MAG: hypothetical protein WCS52_11525 [bacterium]
MRKNISYLVFAVLLAASLTYGSDVRILATDRDMDGLTAFPAKPVVSWQWTPEEKRQADHFSRMELSRDSAGAMLLTLNLSPLIPFKRPYLELLNLGVKYFPPEADAIRLKVRAVSGRMIIGFGGPTAYFGNSDAFLRPVFVDAARDGTEWRTVEVSLHYGLFRNFRRAGYSINAPWIYYARWAQEPTFLYAFKGSGGDIQIKDIELVARDLAKPFPVFSDGEVTPVAILADFTASNAADKCFSVLVGQSNKEFDGSWNAAKPGAHPPAAIRILDDREAGRFLHARGVFLEEVSAVGVTLATSQAGEGFRFRIKTDTDAMNLMLPAVPCQPLDFLLYEVPDPVTFDWSPFLASQELRKGATKGYDRNLSYDTLRGVPGLSLAIYHARRFIPKGQWCDPIVPFADFLCIYGCGGMTDRFEKQLPPSPGKLIAAAILAPWPRKGRAEISIDLRDIALVTFKESQGSRQSYFQFPEPARLKSVKSRKGYYSFLLAPGESALPPELKHFMDELE